MTTTCPNGHESTWPDWCSTCGERLGGAPDSGAPDSGAPDSGAPDSGAPDSGAPDSGAAPAHAVPTSEMPSAAASGPTCENCGVSRHDDDVFCESCGYDFASGSLPAASQSSDADPGVPTVVEFAPMHAKVSIDEAFFAASVGEVDLTLPDPLPPQQTVPFAGTRILIGRKSTSRGIFPEIDVRALTDDPAVSSRHAMLERAADGTWTLTDLGSTNGTFMTVDADPPIEAGDALPITPGTSIYLGAWTRIDLAETTE